MLAAGMINAQPKAQRPTAARPAIISVERFSPWGTDLTQVFFKSGGDASIVVMSFGDFLERYMDQAPTLPGYETL